jgi:hypothetical protein
MQPNVSCILEGVVSKGIITIVFVLVKVERSKRYEEEIIHILSPRPPTGPRVSHAQHSGPEGEHSESSESVSDASETIAIKANAQ